MSAIDRYRSEFSAFGARGLGHTQIGAGHIPLRLIREQYSHYLLFWQLAATDGAGMSVRLARFNGVDGARTRRCKERHLHVLA